MNITVMLLGLFIMTCGIFIMHISQPVQLLPIITTQGFVGGMFESSQNPPPQGAQQCGVDLPGCPEGKRCVNGFCRGVDIPALKENGLKVIP